MNGPWCVGLTGGIASGKSSAAAQFDRLGVPVCDADAVARSVVARGSPALAAIAVEFGADSLTADGELDRPAMRRRVFADADARRRLEAITHPAIRREISAWRAAQTADYCVIEAAILFEAGFDALTDRSLLIDADTETRIARLLARDGIDRELAERMIAAQMPSAERRARADDRIDNNGSPEALAEAVQRLHLGYLDRARGHDHGA